jgi:hypothetical protein
MLQITQWESEPKMPLLNAKPHCYCWGPLKQENTSGGAVGNPPMCFLTT